MTPIRKIKKILLENKTVVVLFSLVLAAAYWSNNTDMARKYYLQYKHGHQFNEQRTTMQLADGYGFYEKDEQKGVYNVFSMEPGMGYISITTTRRLDFERLEADNKLTVRGKLPECSVYELGDEKDSFFIHVKQYDLLVGFQTSDLGNYPWQALCFIAKAK